MTFVSYRPVLPLVAARLSCHHLTPGLVCFDVPSRAYDSQRFAKYRGVEITLLSGLDVEDSCRLGHALNGHPYFSQRKLFWVFSPDRLRRPVPEGSGRFRKVPENSSVCRREGSAGLRCMLLEVSEGSARFWPGATHKMLLNAPAVGNVTEAYCSGKRSPRFGGRCGKDHRAPPMLRVIAHVRGARLRCKQLRSLETHCCTHSAV